MSSPTTRTPTREQLRVLTREPWPLPGGGDTAERWACLAELGADDLVLAKLVEPHHDAVAILADLDGPQPAEGQVWAVWAAEPPFAVLGAVASSTGWSLTGSKAFCSGAASVTHALVTAETEMGSRLFAIDVGASGATEDPAGPLWVGAGMARAGTVTLRLDDVDATPVGVAGAYVDRPGFWLGAIGVAACWLGGARAVAETLERSSARLGPHGAAHLGAVRASLDSASLAFDAAASLADHGLLTTGEAERLALSLRAMTAELVESVVSHVGRALGPGPLAFDAEHTARVADLQVFVRQHHAERDLERLGTIGGLDA